MLDAINKLKEVLDSNKSN